jgi:hypothetical protein
MDKNTDAIKMLEYLIQKITDGKTTVINVGFWRTTVEKPIHETSGLYKEFEPSKEYHIDLILAGE